MKLCHGTSNLKYRGLSKRKDREEYLYTCSKCGELWQKTPTSNYYQVGKRKAETKSVHKTIRITPSREIEILDKWDSVQQFVDRATVSCS